jgi:thymidylate synthase
MHQEYQYLDLIRKILREGKKKQDRTGTGTLSIPHAMISFDLEHGFPLLTTKRMAFKSIKVELEGFIKGIKSKKWYQERGCSIWDEWCNPQKVPYATDEETKKRMLAEDDLGEIYGVQWRDFNNQGYDQLRKIIETLKTNPYDRRMVCSAWNPLALDKQALPPCHYSWVVSVDDRLHLSFNMRSVDVGLGLPFNIASYALLAHLLSLEANIPIGTVTGFLNNVHIYNDHITGLTIQLNRIPYDFPKIQTVDFDSIYDWNFEQTKVIGYKSHEKIPLPIAV